jgi:hypothetical protein
MRNFVIVDFVVIYDTLPFIFCISGTTLLDMEISPCTAARKITFVGKPTGIDR